MMAKTLPIVKAVVNAPTAHRTLVRAGVEKSLPYRKRTDSLIAYIVTASIVSPARETLVLSAEILDDNARQTDSANKRSVRGLQCNLMFTYPILDDWDDSGLDQLFSSFRELTAGLRNRESCSEYLCEFSMKNQEHVKNFYKTYQCDHDRDIIVSELDPAHPS